MVYLVDTGVAVVRATCDVCCSVIHKSDTTVCVCECESAPITNMEGCRQLVVRDVPQDVSWEYFQSFISNFGSVSQCERHGNAYTVTFETSEEAEAALTHLKDTIFEGAVLHVELASDRGGMRANRGRGGIRTNAIAGGPSGGLPGRQPDFPLRILVPSDMVGAIIGRQGGTIRQITQQTRARVDVHRKDNAGSLEKAITIYGNPDNCSNACKRILDVMQQEANNTNKGEVSLKILAHNNLIGRIIGKGGNVIKKIMQDTETKITVSSINDISSFNVERIITVRGSIEDMSKAEVMISAKLRQSYENDLQAMAPQAMMFPGLHPMAMMSTLGVGTGLPRAPGFGLYSQGPQSYPSLYPGQMQPPSQETTYLYIPNSAVGAIIGQKGSHVRSIIRFSGASVKIAPLSQEGSTTPNASTTSATAETPQQERKVTVVGTPEAQWKAQYMVFEKMREEGFCSGLDEVRLTVEIMVPSSQVGRIIGKGGNNVREMQRVTGSVIKLPELGSTVGEETPVHIIGAFYSVQSAQRRIRAMLNQMPPAGRRSTGLPQPPPALNTSKPQL